MKRRTLLVLAVGLVSLTLNLVAGTRTGFNPDESRWIHRAHFLRDLADPFGPTWADGYETRGQPPLGSYVMGLGLLLQGRDLETNGPWNYAYQGTRGWYQNIFDGNMPSAADLAAARRTSALLAALTAVGVCLLLLRLATPSAAAAGGSFLAAHPFNAYIGGIATADALLGLLIVLAALAACRLADRPSWPNALLLGTLLGLGGATKLSPLFVSLPLAALGLGLILFPRVAAGWAGHGCVARLGPQLLALPAIAAAVFIAVYPYLWPNPLSRTIAIFTFRVGEMRQQSGDWPVMAVDSRAEAVRRVGTNFGERYGFAGTAEAALARGAGLEWQIPPLDLLAMLIGTIVFAALALRAGPSPRLLTFVVLLGQVVVTVAGMRSEFDRYHVPMAVAGAVAVGLLAGQAAPLLGRVAASGRRERLAPPARELPVLPVRGSPPSPAVRRGSRTAHPGAG